MRVKARCSTDARTERVGCPHSRERCRTSRRIYCVDPDAGRAAFRWELMELRAQGLRRARPSSYTGDSVAVSVERKSGCPAGA
jgi:hypothetical protein